MGGALYNHKNRNANETAFAKPLIVSDEDETSEMKTDSDIEHSEKTPKQSGQIFIALTSENSSDEATENAAPIGLLR